MTETAANALEDAEWPRFGWITDMRPALADAQQRGATVALATIVALDGSAPRPVGTQMLFEGNRALGYFSGGCLEADVALHAAQVVASWEPRLLIYGRGSPWIDIRLTCGGRMEILVERIAPGDASVRALIAAGEARVPVTWESDGRTRRVIEGCPGPGSWADGRISLPFLPARRLLVAGGEPAALAMATLARGAGWEVEILRPETVGPDALLPSRSGLSSWLADLEQADQRTAIAVATHESDLDHEVLMAALGSHAAYVGVLGSRSRLPERLARLSADGADVTRLHAPMGVVPTGKGPWEIAVAVIAEIMAVFEEAAQ